MADFSTYNINPCFQALVSCHVLVPEVQQFEVYAEGDEVPSLLVSADALKRTRPIWERALNKFRSMPFSTFLPANLDARSNREALTKVVRSVSWIALEDLFDALGSSAEQVDAENLKFLIERTELVATATKECLAVVPPESATRLRATHSVADEILDELKSLHAPVQLRYLYGTAAVLEAERIWKLWGPVPRLPGVSKPLHTTPNEDPTPRLRSEQDLRELRWRTI